jgi:hypothetical protein
VHIDELGQSLSGTAKLLAELAMGDLKAAHRGPLPFGVVGGGSTETLLELGELNACRRLTAPARD